MQAFLNFARLTWMILGYRWRKMAVSGESKRSNFLFRTEALEAIKFGRYISYIRNDKGTVHSFQIK